MKRFSLFAALFFVPLVLSFFPSPMLPAQSSLNPGDLDPTFGSGGLVFTDFGGLDTAMSVVLQPDGKIVAAGRDGKNGFFALARYDSSGQLDLSFGSGGKVTTKVGTGSNVASDVVLQPDGKIIVAGEAAVTVSGARYYNFAVVRYKPTGELDRSFDGDGKVTTQVGLGFDKGHAVALQPDGKIIVAGEAFVEGSSRPHFAVVRYKPNGALDPDFDDDGKVTTAIGDESIARAVVLQPDGKIVVAGEADSFLDPKVIPAVVRYQSDGQLDESFGDGGIAWLSKFGYVKAMVLQPDGKIVVAGDGCGPFVICGFAVARVKADGQPDPTFSKDGTVITDFRPRSDIAEAVVLQPDGKIVAGGFSNEANDPYDPLRNDLALVRYDSYGNLDSSFGVDGRVVTQINFHDERIRALALQPDGRIVVAGGRSLDDLYKVDFMVGRYIGYFPADLRVSINGLPETIEVQKDFSGTLTVTNSGPEPATGVVVKTLPAAGLIVLSITPSQGNCSSEMTNSGFIECELGGIPKGGSAAIQVQLRALQEGVSTYSATVEAGTVDQNLSDNKLTVSIQAASPPPTSTSAPVSVCGDGVVDTGEQCDDGNTSDGDGCSSGCISETSESETESQSQSSTGGGGCSCNLCRQ